MAETILVEGLTGLGDAIYQRPFIRALSKRADVWLTTPWPELYADLPIRFARPEGAYRTHLGYDYRDVRRIPADRVIKLAYGDDRPRRLYADLERLIPLGETPFRFDLPDLGPSAMFLAEKPIAVVRPVTLRRDWPNPARNPDPHYVAELAAEVRKTHHVVLLGALKPGHEWLVGEAPPHDTDLSHGQLGVLQALALVRDADLCLGGVGWLVPAAIALKTHAFIVLGGRGGLDGPDAITDPRMDLCRIGWGLPHPYCADCTDMRHQCPKDIPDLWEQWTAWRTSVSTSAVG